MPCVLMVNKEMPLEDFQYTINDIFNSKHKSKLITRVRQGEANPILPYADYFWENSQKENP